ncbi:MAG: mechanosensitive ion channel family protein [Rhizobiaceae bacterium]
MFLRTAAKTCRIAGILFVLLSVVSAAAWSNPASTPEQKPDVQEFLRLLGKADVQEWLNQQRAPTTEPGGQHASLSETSFGQAFSERLTAIRVHLAELSRIVPELGTEIRQAIQKLSDASGGSGPLSFLVNVALCAGLGLGAQAFARSRIKSDHGLTGAEEPSLGSQRRQPLKTAVFRELVGVLAFCIACFAPPLLLARDRLSESVLLTFLAACAAWVVSRAVASIIAAPVESDSSPECRTAKNYVCFWMVAATGWFALGIAIAETMHLTDMDPRATELVSYVLGFGLLTIGLIAIWRAPRNHILSSGSLRRRDLSLRWLATLCIVTLWIVWVADAMRLFWLLAIGVMTPIVLKASRKLIRNLFLTEQDGGTTSSAPTPVVVVDTLLRAALIGIALWVLAGAWEISFSDLAARDDPVSKVARAILMVLAILFAFDILWQFTKTAIDLKIARTDSGAAADSQVDARQARLRTLLPVLRNFAMVVFATLAVLMTLSTLGVEIGPLIASAGVVGLAIGFGAQTLVKDVISGVFYLLDDAFRVGEYIVSGSYTGTVESFSLRSVRLRHHRGPVFTIPFSALGAVQNMSRNYAVDKLLITVSYDADLERVRKLIKRVGQQLMEDPELATLIIEPLKMQAVSDFGTYGIQLKLKVMTKPGFQSAVRKKALPLIKKAFDENGIEFAHPTVKVADSQAPAQLAAGQQVLAASTSSAASQPA